VQIDAHIYIDQNFYQKVSLGEKLGNEENFTLEISAGDINRLKKNSSPEILSIESIIKENVHSIRKNLKEDAALADVIESGDISIHLEDANGRLYKMIQILDMNSGVYPPSIDFFECDADIDDFGVFLLCTLEQDPQRSAIILTFKTITDPLVIEKIKSYRLTRDLRLLDVGSGICLNVKSLTPYTESEEDSFEIGQLLLLERLISKIQRNRISKRNRRRYYILGEKIFKELQKVSR